VTGAQFWSLVVAVTVVLSVAAAWAAPVTLAGHFAISAGVVLVGGFAALLPQLG
jgi:hypothetical protein